MRSMKIIVCMIVFLSIHSLYGKEIVFLGLFGEGAPSIEKTFDKLLRQQLAMTPHVQLTDYVQTQRYRNLIDFDRYPVVSDNLLRTLTLSTPDSTIFIWGMVKECVLDSHRKKLIHSEITGQLTISLNIYNFENHNYDYVGDISASVTKKKGLIFFDKTENAVHISAIDRTELLQKLQDDAVDNTTRVIVAIMEADEKKNSNRPEVVPPAAEVPKEPSISDVFSIPSIEAAPLDTISKAQNNTKTKNGK